MDGRDEISSCSARFYATKVSCVPVVHRILRNPVLQLGLCSHAATLRNFIFNFDPIEFKDPEASGGVVSIPNWEVPESLKQSHVSSAYFPYQLF